MVTPQTSRLELNFNDRVRPPEHEYAPEDYPIDLAEAFDQFSSLFMEFFKDHGSYPNATMNVEPSPGHIRPETISFMFVWGTGTELPHPRHHKLVEYFGDAAVKQAERRHRSLEKVLLDGHGFFGRVMTRGDLPVVKTVMGNTTSQKPAIFTNELLTRSATDLSIIDIASNLQVYRPLRLHAGVKWHSSNNHIFNQYFTDDESDMLACV